MTVAARLTVVGLISLSAACGGPAPEHDGGMSADRDGSVGLDARSAAADAVAATQEAEAPRPDAGTASTDAAVASGGRSAGCGMPAAAGYQCFNESFRGANRRWCAFIPDGYNPNTPRSVVVGLHGCGGSPEGVHRNSTVIEAAGAADHLYIFPAAAGGCWEYNWPDDVDTAFVEFAIAQTHARFCTDPGRVFANGMSSGGMMASRLLCDNTVRASAAISLNFACNTVAAHPIWLYGGTSDSYFTPYIVPGRDRWLFANRCSMNTVPIPGSPCVEYQGCAQRTIWCSDARGHAWPNDPWVEGIIGLFRSVPAR